MQENLKAGVAAGTAIFRGDRILLLHRALRVSNPGIWDLPGGHVQSRESLTRAARRETREETGFEVRLGLPFHVGVFSSLSKQGRMRWNVGVYFHCAAPTRKTPRLDPEEHTEYAWVSAGELNDYPTIPFLSRTIRAAFFSRNAAHGQKQVGVLTDFSEPNQPAFPVPA